MRAFPQVALTPAHGSVGSAGRVIAVVAGASITAAGGAHPVVAEARLDEPLCRWLWLVKFWLLAIPHFVILAALLGTWTATDGTPVGAPGTLQGLALNTGVMLLSSGRYPLDVFHLAVGINRWAFRFLAYAAGMRDEYPPSRFER